MKRKIRLTESQLHNIIRKNIKSVINEDVEHWKDNRYMTISLLRLNFLMSELSEIIKHTPEVQAKMDEIFTVIENALEATGNSGQARVTKVPNYSDFD